MNTVDIITKKRDKYTLTQDEIEYIITGAVDGSIPDYQLSAFLMASFINSLNDEETFYITKAMLQSGKILDFSDIDGIKTDKHSTGGVGDTTTLILAPAVSSLGVPVIKMSGRGLGFSGGTIDKLSAIPGFSTEISMEKAKELAKKSGIVLMGQSESIALADKIFYSLRDVTGTVESTALIAVSYTHLDVYKRQVLTSCIFFNSIFSSELPYNWLNTPEGLSVANFDVKPDIL